MFAFTVALHDNPKDGGDSGGGGSVEEAVTILATNTSSSSIGGGNRWSSIVFLTVAAKMHLERNTEQGADQLCFVPSTNAPRVYTLVTLMKFP